jgi:hypothetical protein
MIWQLMKRDPAWRWTPLCALAAAACCLVWHFAGIGKYGSMSLPIVFFTLLFIGGSTLREQRIDTRFQAALPITVRQVYLSRVLSTLAEIWLTATAAVVLALALRAPADPLVALLKSLSVVTLAIMILQSAGVRGINIPTWLIVGAGFGCAVFIADLDTPPLVPLICWIAVAGIFLATWQTVPKSFQSAPLKVSPAAKRDGVPRGVGTSRFHWISLWRTIFPLDGFWILVPFVMMALSTFRPVILIYAASAFQSARPRIRWLFALPVRPRALLAAVLLPLLLSISAGYLVSVRLPSLPTAYSRRLSLRARQNLPEWLGYSRDPDCKTLNVLPPVDFWVLAKDGKAPLSRPHGARHFSRQCSA